MRFKFLSFPPANCPAANDIISSGTILHPKPERILNRNTNGTGICIAIIQCLENLGALSLQYPKGRLIKKTSNINSIIDIVMNFLFYLISILPFVIYFIYALKIKKKKCIELSFSKAQTT